MKQKKPFVEPVLLKHKEKLDEITMFNGLGSHGADSGSSSGRRGKHGKCPLGFK